MKKIKEIYHKALKSIRHSLLKTKIIVVVILGLILALSGILYFKSQTQSASANWWNETWKYRQSVTLPDHASLETNVYFQLTVDTSTLISAGKMQSDCGDIRLTTTDGNVLPYYIVSGCNTGTTVINILFDSYPAGTVVLYMYYGNASATNGFSSTNFNVSAASNGTTTVTYSVITGNDDGDTDEVVALANSISRISIPLGSYSGNTHLGIARFNNVAIPQGTTLISSSITLTGSDTYNCGACNMLFRIEGEDVDDSVALTTANMYNRTKTSANVAWSQQSVVLNTEYSNVITAVVQEIIDRPGWVSGNDLSIIVEDNGSDSNEWQEFFSYDGDPTKAPELSITYGGGSATFGSEENTPAPVAYWKFNEGVGSTANDSVGTNAGALGSGSSAPTWVNDQCVSEKCLQFDGSNDYVQSNDNAAFDITGELTISAWIKPSQLTSGTYYTLVYKGNSTNEVNYYFQIYGDELNFGNYQGEWKGTNSTSANLQVNRWYHVAVTYSDTDNDIDFYVNGQLQSDDGLNHDLSISANNQPLYIGTSAAELDFYKGLLDEVKIYNYARSAAELKSDYATRGSTKGVSAQFGDDDLSRRLSSGLVGYWKMDEVGVSGSNWTAVDSSGNNSSGIGAGNVVPSSGKYGSGGLFDGNGDWINLGSSLNMSTTHTLSYWLNYWNAGDAVVLGNVDSQYATYIDGPSSGGSIYYRPNPSSNYVSVVHGGLTQGTWYQFTIVRDGTSVIFYKNGVQLGTAQTLNSNYDMLIDCFGANCNSNSFPLDGYIDEVRFYNRAFNSSEIQDLYNFAPGPAAYWNMEEGSGLYAYDTSGNGNTGTLSCNGAGCAKPNWTNGKFGKGMNFDTCTGTADRWIDAGSGFSIDNIWDGGGNVSLWLYPRSVSGQILNKNNDSWYLTYAVSGNMANITLVKIFATGNNRWTTGYVVPINSWSFISVAYNADSTTNNATIYVNGIPQAATLTGTPTGARTDDSGGNLSIGDWGWHNNCGQQAHGILDEIRFYNYIRTPSQILEDMNGGHPVGGSPIGSEMTYWKMDEGYGDYAYDSGILGERQWLAGGDSCPGDTECPTWTNDGKFGKALSFDGGDFMESGTHPAYDNGGSSPYAATLWFKSTTNPTNNYGLMGITTINTNNQDRFLQVNSSGLPRFYVYDGTERYATGNTVVTDGTWHHLGGIFDGDKIYLYVDGILEATTDVNYSQNHTDTITQVIFSDEISGYYDRTVGIIDEAKIFNAALTPEQILIDYNHGNAQVMGAGSTGVGGTSPSNSASREYCVPGDSSTCSPSIAEWKMDEGSGSTINDTSGNGNTATINNGPTWISGKKGKAIQFDGDNDYIATSNNSVWDPTQAFTLSAWIKPYSFGEGGGGEIIGKEGRAHFFIDDTNNNLEYCNDSTCNEARTADNSIILNEWQHVSAVYDGNGTMMMYINGIDRTTESTTGEDSGTGVTLIGGESTGTTSYTFDGIIDDVKIFNYARTPAQVAWEYNRGAPIAYYKLNECTGSTAYDSSISQNNGTITIGATGTQTSAGTCSSGISTEAWNNGTSGKLGTSLNFDGTNDYVDLGNPTELQIGASTPFTIAMWTKLNSDTQSFLVSKGGDDGSNQSWRISYISTLDRYEFYTSSNGTSGSATACGPTSGSSITVGQWYHIAAVYNPSTTSRTCYVNGKAGNTGNAGSSLFNSTANLYVGKEHSSSTLQFYPGQVDDLGIYNYPLTSAQILTVMAGGAVNFR